MARGRVLIPRELPIHRSVLFVRGVLSRPVPKVEVRSHVKLPASHGPRYCTRRGTAVR
jgi:hypothetical protein